MIRLLFLIAVLLSLFCSNNSSLTATETETHTGVVSGLVLNEDSTVAENVHINLHALETDTPLIFETITDHNGYFSIDSLPAGAYLVESLHELFGSAVKITIPDQDTVLLISLLTHTGTIVGKLCVPFLDRIIKVSLEIPELNRTVTLDSTGYFQIATLPPYNNYTLQFTSLNLADASPFKILNVDLPSGDTVSVGNIALFSGNARVHASPVDSFIFDRHATIVVTGDDILPITGSASIRQDEVYATIENIPEGLDRIFSVTISDSTGNVLCSGTDTADVLVDQTIELTIQLIYLQTMRDLK